MTAFRLASNPRTEVAGKRPPCASRFAILAALFGAIFCIAAPAAHAQAPPTPTLSVAYNDPSSGMTTLSWTNEGSGVTYYVYSSPNPDGAHDGAWVIDESETSFDAALPNNKPIYFVVWAQNSSGSSPQSSPFEVEPTLSPPSATATPTASGEVISWSSAPNATGYLLRYEPSLEGPWYIFDGNNEIYGNSTSVQLNPGKADYFEVYSDNAGGESAPSNIAGATRDVTPPPPDRNSDPSDGPCGGCTGPSAGDPVDVATGAEDYQPPADLTVYNPSGPTATFQREYRSDLAIAGYSTPGLSAGWTDNYDYTISETSGSWSNALTLVYPNGAQETLTPVLSGGEPTGAFTTVAGAPYLVSGSPSGTAGLWDSVTITRKDRSQWTFTPVAGALGLTEITNAVGQSLSLAWNSGRQLTSVTDVTSGTTLLSLSYNQSGDLSSVTDAYSRQVDYTFDIPTGSNVPFLETVSQVVPSGTQSPAAHWTFGYSASTGCVLLNTIAVPSPAGSGTSTAQIDYNSSGQVSSLVDANGNQRIYTQGSGSTLVQVENSADAVAYSVTRNFDSSDRDTGFTDASDHSTQIAYADSNNPHQITSFTDRNGKKWTFTYL
jgi:YD repeat-containing protein